MVLQGGLVLASRLVHRGGMWHVRRTAVASCRASGGVVLRRIGTCRAVYVM